MVKPNSFSGEPGLAENGLAVPDATGLEEGLIIVKVAFLTW